MTTSGLSDPSSNSIIANSVKALALCRGGAIHDGIGLYKQILKAKYDLRKNLPVALHLRFLENMGLNDAAAAIRLDAIMAGQNLCLKADLGKAPLEVVAEYRHLFAQGIVNSGMVADYLIELSKLGETTELASFLDVNRFVRCVELSIADDGMRGEKFWETIAANLLEARTNHNWQEAVQSVRGMHFIPHLDQHDDKRIQRSLSEISRHVELYVADLRTNGRGTLPWIPQKYCIDPWALISSGYGYNVPHIHHRGWITGVLYIAGPNEIGPDGYPVGALRIGPSKAAASAVGWPDFAVAPKPGTLVLLPSYFTHWTVPLGKPALRISIAFDVVDLRIATP
jgi:Putative 2OG-Fe(II) oxygenase